MGNAELVHRNHWGSIRERFCGIPKLPHHSCLGVLIMLLFVFRYLKIYLCCMIVGTMIGHSSNAHGEPATALNTYPSFDLICTSQCTLKRHPTSSYVGLMFHPQ